jgi:hypothetical protein
MSRQSSIPAPALRRDFVLDKLAEISNPRRGIIDNKSELGTTVESTPGTFFPF